jgi:hypothetical protein
MFDAVIKEVPAMPFPPLLLLLLLLGFQLAPTDPPLLLPGCTITLLPLLLLLLTPVEGIAVAPHTVVAPLLLPLG